MKVFRYPVGELQANCYFLVEDRECIIVDPGDSADFLLEEISRKNLKPVAMIATHGHFDHIMAAGEIQLSFNLPLLINIKDEFLVKRVGETAAHFLTHIPEVIPPKIKNLEEGEIKIGAFKFQIIGTPGHTPGSSCLYFEKDGALFTGDTMFAQGGIGRYDFKYSNKKDLYESIKTKLLTLPEETIFYPGHGDDSLIQTARLELSFL